MKNCPYCGNTGKFCFKFSSRIYYRCQGCDLVYKGAQQPYDKILAGYRNDYFSRHSSEQLGGSRDKLFNHILDLIEESQGVGSLLDIGTGCGFFLVAAQKKGWKVKGVEPSIQSVKFGRKENRLDIFHGTLREYEGDSQFDAISFINVLDHSAEPWKEIERARKLLKPGGFIYIRFPNGLLHTRLYRLGTKFGVANQVAKFLVFHELPIDLADPTFLTSTHLSLKCLLMHKQTISDEILPFPKTSD